MTDLTIYQGSTFSRVLRWETSPLVSTPITGLTAAAPAVITAIGHGLVTGWRAAVVSAGGMRQINAQAYPPRAVDFHKVTVASSSQVSMNDVNSAGFSPYTSGGFLISYTPASLAGYSARMQIRSTVDAIATLASLVSPTDIALDDVNHTITITISAAATALYTFAQAVYDIELVSGAPTPVVTKLLSGNVFVSPEVTR